MKKENPIVTSRPNEPFGQSPASAVSGKSPQERSLFGLAAELKNLLRGDRIFRSEQTQRLELRNEKKVK